jgi:Flp pilus assembly protein TadD
MRLKRWPKHRLQAAGIAPVAFAACVFALGCQGASYDHTDGTSTAFNANRVPAADGSQALASSMSQIKTSASAPAEAAGATKSASANSNEALVAENLNLGHREAALNRFDQAEAYYRRVLEIQPDNTVANHRLAVLADKKSDFARAEHYYLTALRHDGRNADLLGDVGYSYLLQGRRQESERYLLAATQIDPTHSKALHNLSLLYAMNGDYDRSFDALRRAVGENEARVKIARLFPNGRPGSSNGDEMVASFEPSPSGDVNSASGLPVSAEAPVSKASEPSAATGLTEPVATTTAAAPATITAGAPATMLQPANPLELPTGRIPDSQINDVFAAIDREPAQKSAAPSTSPTPITTGPSAAATASQAPSPTSSGTNDFDTADLQAPPGSNPLASMPMWSPAPPKSSPPKAPAEYLFDVDPVPVNTPKAVPLDVVPTSGNTPSATGQEGMLSDYKAALRRDQAANDVRTQSNGGGTRAPLVAEPPKTAQAGSPDSPSSADKTALAPFDAAPPISIQPRTNPAPLFEPVEGFGPGNDFSPVDDNSIPAWPGATGTATSSSGNGANVGPEIRPGS